MTLWIHQHEDWPNFKWDTESLKLELVETDRRISEWMPYNKALQDAKLIHGMDHELELTFLTEAVVKSSNIEGEFPDEGEVRKSISGRLKEEMEGNKSKKYKEFGEWDGMIEMILDANRRSELPLNRKRLSEWHVGMFPGGLSEGRKIETGNWRPPSSDPTRVGSGKGLHYETPSAVSVPYLMEKFLDWFESDEDSENLFIKAGKAHLWFELIHPFQDGNGRIGRAVCDMMLARANIRNYGGVEPFHNLTARIAQEREGYYDILESTARGTLDITAWLKWFLGCFARSINDSKHIITGINDRINVLNLALRKGINDRQKAALYRIYGDNRLQHITNEIYREMSKSTSRAMAKRDIAKLVEMGIFIRNSGEGRNASYRLVTWEEVRNRENIRRTEQARVVQPGIWRTVE